MIDSSPIKKINNLKSSTQVTTDQIRCFLIESDLDGNLTYMSSQACDFIGYKPEEVIGMNIFKFIHPDDRSNLVSYMKTLKKYWNPIRAKFRVLHKEGYYIRLSLIGVISKGKKVFKLIVDFRAISTLKKK
ncbi:MAG: PAS domain-containing protein [Promethearchaeota archaeon]